MRTPNFTPAYSLPPKRKCHTRPHGHIPSVHCALYNLLYAVLPDTMLRQYVFVPVATEYFPQTDHLSDATVIPGCRFVCLCLWHCCRLILLPPTRLQPPLGPPSPCSISTLFFPSPISVSCNLLRNVPSAFNPSATSVILLTQFYHTGRRSCTFSSLFSL